MQKFTLNAFICEWIVYNNRSIVQAYMNNNL